MIIIIIIYVFYIFKKVLFWDARVKKQKTKLSVIDVLNLQIQPTWKQVFIADHSTVKIWT